MFTVWGWDNRTCGRCHTHFAGSYCCITVAPRRTTISGDSFKENISIDCLTACLVIVPLHNTWYYPPMASSCTSHSQHPFPTDATVCGRAGPCVDETRQQHHRLLPPLFSSFSAFGSLLYITKVKMEVWLAPVLKHLPCHFPFWDIQTTDKKMENLSACKHTIQLDSQV
jgi:hypothetical protein